VNECKTNNGGCHSKRKCINLPGSMKCDKCQGGWLNDGAKGCKDVNECKTNNGGCHSKRKCINLPGSMKCDKCQRGWLNDGAKGCKGSFRSEGGWCHTANNRDGPCVWSPNKEPSHEECRQGCIDRPWCIAYSFKTDGRSHERCRIFAASGSVRQAFGMFSAYCGDPKEGPVNHGNDPRWKTNTCFFAEGRPNVCSCTNGSPQTGAGCTKNGAAMCKSCKVGWTLNSDKTACIRPTKTAFDGYKAMGTGECVDSAQTRPGLCWTTSNKGLISNNFQPHDCAKYCTARASCFAFEAGKNGGVSFCDLALTGANDCPTGWTWATHGKFQMPVSGTNRYSPYKQCYAKVKFTGLDVAAVCKTHGGKPINGNDFKNGQIWGFALARRVAKGNKWHPATDELRGTDSYGSAPTNPTSGPTGTMKWNYNAVQYFLFSTGDFSEWMIMKRSVIDSKFGGPKAQQILCSSSYNTPRSHKQYYRNGASEDPWLSYLDHGTSSMMYGESSYNGHSENVLKGGMNVWIYPPPQSQKASPKWMDYDLNHYTYRNAVYFCKKHGGDLCSRAQYCSGHRGGALLTGATHMATGDKWAPVRDNYNSWIQTGATHTNGHGHKQCWTHSELGHGRPSWGLSGLSPQFGRRLCCAL